MRVPELRRRSALSMPFMCWCASDFSLIFLSDSFEGRRRFAGVLCADNAMRRKLNMTPCAERIVGTDATPDGLGVSASRLSLAPVILVLVVQNFSMVVFGSYESGGLVMSSSSSSLNRT